MNAKQNPQVLKNQSSLKTAPKESAGPKSKRPKYYGAKMVRGDDEIIFAAFDVETQGLGGELLMIQTGIFGEVKTDSSPGMVANFYAEICKYPSPVVWYAHFAQYDWRYLMQHLIDAKLDVYIGMRTDNDVYEITIKLENGKKVIMRDSYAFWNSTLEKLAECFCPEIPKLKIDIENFNPVDPEHIEYAKRDVNILLTGMPRLNDMVYRHFGVNINATTASTALKAWQKSLADEQLFNASVLDEKEVFIRQAYYGGIVLLTDTATHKDCTTYDVNSSYPSVMVDYGVPYGESFESVNYCENIPGIYKCRVKTPDNLKIPIIPARNEKGSMRWYRGEFDTVCTNKELIFAATQGYEIKKIYSGIVWEKMVFPFNDFIEKCKAIRKEFKGLPEEMLAKLMQNALYGKFGSRRERTKLFAIHNASEADLEDSKPFDDEGNWYSKTDPDDTGRTLPAWAVFITAHARLKLLQAAYSIGVENVIYGDTDSLTIKAGSEGNMNIGDQYGQFKLEKSWTEFRAIAPKVYSGITSDGKRRGAAKGLPKKNLTSTHWQELLETGETCASVLSLDSLRITLKKGVKPATLLMRKSSTLNNSQNYNKLDNDQISIKLYA